MRNWAGTHTYRARTVHRPSTLDELRRVVAGAAQINVLGTRHTFNGIGDGAQLVSPAALPASIEPDAGAGTVELTGAVRYGELALALEPHGLALHNLASLPHISVAGAVATATHGSGDANGNLASAVRALELVTSDGEIVRAARGDEDFDGMVVGLGALGVVTRLTLDTEPAYRVRQFVFERLSWDALSTHFDAILGAGHAVSVFTRWGEDVDQVWVKLRDGEPDPGDLLGAVAAREERHPILGMDPVNCTAQQGVPGPWFDRLPHFRIGFTPSSGAEIQSEYAVARHHAVEAIGALRALGGILGPLTQVAEIRTVAADRLWMSPQYERDTVGIHFTWVPDAPRVRGALEQVEAALAPFEARPHWGKLFLAPPPAYPRHDDFVRLAERLDPRGAFRNGWLGRYVMRS